MTAEFVDKPDWDRGPMGWDYELAVEEQGATLVPVMRDMRIEDKQSAEFNAAAVGWNRQAAGSGGAQQPAPALR